MTETTDATTGGTNRRTFLRGAGVAGAVLGGFAAPAMAKKGKGNGGNGEGEPPNVPLDFMLYAGGPGEDSNDPDQMGDFGYPDRPFFALHDHFNQFFDPRILEVKGNGKVLKHSLQFFQGWLIDNKPKPYVLVHEGGGTYSSRGQHMNFDARPWSEIKAKIEALAGMLGLGPDQTKGLVMMMKNSPIGTLAGGSWRAVGSETVQMVHPTPDAPWATTRVDFYSRGGGKPEYTTSILYVIWADFDGEPDDIEPKEGIPGLVHDDAVELITAGRMNLGGQ